jgi:thiamine biosynthesis lipoprotein ApbE
VRSVLLILSLALAACGGSSSSQVEIVGLTMGTYFNVKLPQGVGDHDPLQLQKAIEAELEDDEQEMSTYLPAFAKR